MPYHRFKVGQTVVAPFGGPHALWAACHRATGASGRPRTSLQDRGADDPRRCRPIGLNLIRPSLGTARLLGSAYVALAAGGHRGYRSGAPGRFGRGLAIIGGSLLRPKASSPHVRSVVDGRDPPGMSNCRASHQTRGSMAVPPHVRDTRRAEQRVLDSCWRGRRRYHPRRCRLGGLVCADTVCRDLSCQCPVGGSWTYKLNQPIAR